MQSQEQGLIDGLFDRLKQAQARDSERDQQADQLIRQHLAQQPDAPYYMTQALLIQQAALTRLNERIKELESSQSAPSGGSFLSGLFGSESNPPPRFTPPPATAPAQPASRASSFLGGALQTAAGVAGGVMLADMIGGLFHNNRPEEIIDIIEPAPIANPVDAEPVRWDGWDSPPDAGSNFLDDDSQSSGWADSDDNNDGFF
ncbi:MULTISPECIES: DUF2076 domain-containing protein [Aeromonas]|uniref:DUF2076 domain-containing protein n=1 Tax=Aeromonas TaxID=642 RepID=UPI0018F15C2D|nr:DUF2076 domain-containing protein [Aeromonas veronii]MBJ7580524.1 DUF2076 domain-containing protein [Aeromonas veronii]MEB5668729.1 DUF2076 domain-containing protein [Aeromonas veronii]HDX8428064.1 DUF2076 domain-containing protein [Aeromonas veronii]